MKKRKLMLLTEIKVKDVGEHFNDVSPLKNADGFYTFTSTNGKKFFSCHGGYDGGVHFDKIVLADYDYVICCYAAAVAKKNPDIAHKIYPAMAKINKVIWSFRNSNHVSIYVDVNS